MGKILFEPTATLLWHNRNISFLREDTGPHIVIPFQLEV